MEKGYFEVSALIILILFFMASSVFAFPNFINYQGQLTDASGNLLTGDYSLTFMIYGTQTEGESLWTEQHTVTVTNGLYNAELGAVNPFPEDLFETEMLYLEVIIHNEDTGSDETLSPRIPFTSTGFSMKAKDAETVAWSNITGKPATFADDVLYVDSNGNVGIGISTPNASLQIIGAVSRQGTTLNGTYTDTHVNLGVNSFTDANYPIVSGGYNNTAIGNYSTVSGGEYNTASGFGSTVSGGSVNTACRSNSTVSGGLDNTASGYWSTVSGGYRNTASGNHSTVSGGRENIASGYSSIVSGGWDNISAGDYSWAGGRNMQLTGNADRTFVWGYSDSNVSISTPDAFIVYSGNVGIGTTNPRKRLQVEGDISLSDLTPSINQLGRTFYLHEGGNKYGMTLLNNGSYVEPTIFTIQSSAISFSSISDWTQPTEYSDFNELMVIKGDTGNVGIGTTSPSRKLDVAGNVIANAYEQHSDARLKKNIAPIKNALDKVSALQGVEFEWRTEEYPEKGLADGRKIGLIAQEVEKVLPEVVSTDNDGYKSVEYANIVCLLIEAVKAQQLQIEGLKSQNTELKKRVKVLEGYSY